MLGQFRSCDSHFEVNLNAHAAKVNQIFRAGEVNRNTTRQTYADLVRNLWLKSILSLNFLFEVNVNIHKAEVNQID